MHDALSPLDGRYASQIDALRPFFSEEALMRARVEVEVRYLIALSREAGVEDLPRFTERQETRFAKLYQEFGPKDAADIKTIEQETNHDVKAVEYYLKHKAKKIPGFKKHLEFIHFGLTSEDVNNLSYGILISRGLEHVILPALKDLITDLQKQAKSWNTVPLLSLTHGQPATPTTVGREIQVFVDRLKRQEQQLKAFGMQGKFGGAVGNYAAHRMAYPKVKWEKFGAKFVSSLGLEPLVHTTQSNPHDDVAELSHLLSRINVIALDFSRDVWLYISRGVFGQKLKAGEIGSSTMPHKVNPIDFENAEGNLGLSTALLTHFAEKLPISRLQRDLSDSTVQRNIGVALGYQLLAISSLRKGIKKLSLNKSIVKDELLSHPEVLAEPIQMILRKRGVPGAYELLKELTRGERVTVSDLRAFMQDQKFSDAEVKRVLKVIGL